MKRDMDLVRSILLEVEEKPPSDHGWVDIKVEGYTPEEIWYHVKILDEAGLIKAHDLSSFRSDEWKPERLTWEGHEFLESSRDKNRWEKAKKIMADKVGGVSYELIKLLLTQLMKDSVFGT